MTKKNDKPADFSLSGLAVKDSEAPQNHGGRGADESTLQAMEWLKASHAEGDGTIGKPKAIVIPAGHSEYVLNVLQRAASALDSGIDKEAVNLAGGKVEIRFRTRPKRNYKGRATAAA